MVLFCCTVQFSGESLTTGRVDGAGFRNVVKVPSCQCSHLRSRVPASVRPADTRLSRGQWYRAALCISVCELAGLALELDLAACEVVSKSCFWICILVACLGLTYRLRHRCAWLMQVSKIHSHWICLMRASIGNADADLFLHDEDYTSFIVMRV